MIDLSHHVTSSLRNVGGCRLQAQAVIDFSQVMDERRANLLTAVDKGLIIPSDLQLNLLYEMIAAQCQWPDAHKWIPHGIFRVPDAQKLEAILLLTFPRPHFSVVLTDWGARVSRTTPPGETPAQVEMNTILMDELRAQDTRHPGEVERIMNLIDNGGTLTVDIL